MHNKNRQTHVAALSHVLELKHLRLVSDIFSDCVLPSAVVTCFLKFLVGIVLSPLAILKSRFSKSGIGSPVPDAEVMSSQAVKNVKILNARYNGFNGRFF